ncbi:iron-sulfur cluster insertion protein ErpA [Aquihabitans sp. G128]|nr:iron-sulfur cluster insertion protein ErpA [Aquihabitans sp. G128]
MTPRSSERRSSGVGRSAAGLVTGRAYRWGPCPPREADHSAARRPNGKKVHGCGRAVRWRRCPNRGGTSVIALTDTAAVKVQELITAEGDTALALRVAVRPGGCSGFSYEMFFDSDIATDDVTADYSGVKVVVDPSSAQMLTGATLDYKDGLNQAGFSIDNPNAQRTCGCGSSFS